MDHAAREARRVELHTARQKARHEVLCWLGQHALPIEDLTTHKVVRVVNTYEQVVIIVEDFYYFLIQASGHESIETDNHLDIREGLSLGLVLPEMEQRVEEANTAYDEHASAMNADREMKAAIKKYGPARVLAILDNMPLGES